jgi:hypothetical protein
MTFAKHFESYNVWSESTTPMLRQIAQMLEVLKALDAGVLPDAGHYTSADLLQYLKSLVSTQGEVPEADTRMVKASGRFWSVCTTVAGMPPESRQTFVNTPTAIAVATLSRCLLQMPVLAASVPGIVDALQEGLRYSAAVLPDDLQFPYNAEFQNTLDIFYMGWLPMLLWQNPRLCPPMNLRLARTPRLNLHVRYELQRLQTLHERLFREDLALRRRWKLDELIEFMTEISGLTEENQRDLGAELWTELMKLEAMPAESVGAGTQELAVHLNLEGALRDLSYLVEQMERMAPTLREVLTGELARTPCLPQRDLEVEAAFLRENPLLRTGRSMTPDPQEREKDKTQPARAELWSAAGFEEVGHEQ